MEKENRDIEKLFEELSELSQTEAIALGGSRATGKSDERSDYDVYIYVTEEIPDEARKEILKKYCSYMEIGNHYWEAEDNCVFNSGVDIDLVYRNLDDFVKGIEHVVVKGNACNGYTACMWHNLLTCKVIYDEKGRLMAAKKRFSIPYPENLKKNIIVNNMNLLNGCLPSYDVQIKKAYIRGDQNSVNHRITEFLASYFDIIFAANEMTHPGEKRLVQICGEQCKILPDHFEENLGRLFSGMFQEEVCGIITEMAGEIRRMLDSCKSIGLNWK